jgi:sulfite reductase alpha subunit-like flavoprotein
MAHSSANKMPLAIKEAVAGALEREAGMSNDDAKEYVRQMEIKGRLIEECWS